MPGYKRKRSYGRKTYRKKGRKAPMKKMMARVARSVIRKTAELKYFDQFARQQLNSDNFVAGNIAEYFNLTAMPAQGVTQVTMEGIELRAQKVVIKSTFENVTTSGLANSQDPIPLRIVVCEFHDQQDAVIQNTNPGTDMLDSAGVAVSVINSAYRITSPLNTRMVRVISDRTFMLGPWLNGGAHEKVLKVNTVVPCGNAVWKKRDAADITAQNKSIGLFYWIARPDGVTAPAAAKDLYVNATTYMRLYFTDV